MFWREVTIPMAEFSAISSPILHEIQYAAALEILRSLLAQHLIDQDNARRAAVALAEIFGVLRRSI